MILVPPSIEDTLLNTGYSDDFQGSIDYRDLKQNMTTFSGSGNKKARKKEKEAKKKRKEQGKKEEKQEHTKKVKQTTGIHERYDNIKEIQELTAVSLYLAESRIYLSRRRSDRFAGNSIHRFIME